MALQGPSGSGKTKGALLLAYGLVQDWGKIAVLDTENKSSHLYAELGSYNVLSIDPPFAPEKYTEAIHFCVQQGIEVVIIDSISHEWEGSGGILDIHGGMTGNSFTNWNNITPRHNDFVQTMLQAPVHIIGTIRSKQDYVLVTKDGKQVPEKVGLKGITRDGMDYEFTLVLEIDIKHNASASKDRTGLFNGKPQFKITPDVGKKILDWCNEGITQTKPTVPERINACKTLKELLHLYHSNPLNQQPYAVEFSNKRKEFVTQPQLNGTAITN
jgi:hypothetical protein